MIKVTRNDDGTWWDDQGKGVFMGEDAKILDKLFGYEEDEMTNRIEELEAIKTMIVEGGDLDEIDARVWCVFNGLNYNLATFKFSEAISQMTHYQGVFDQKVFKKVTRSIDAQKALEVEGWYPIVYAISNGAGCIMGYQASLFSINGKVDAPDSPTKPLFPTEPLARLCCWLCVKQWEIENDR